MRLQGRQVAGGIGSEDIDPITTPLDIIQASVQKPLMVLCEKNELHCDHRVSEKCVLLLGKQIAGMFQVFCRGSGQIVRFINHIRGRR